MTISERTCHKDLRTKNDKSYMYIDVKILHCFKTEKVNRTWPEMEQQILSMEVVHVGSKVAVSQN